MHYWKRIRIGYVSSGNETLKFVEKKLKRVQTSFGRAHWLMWIDWCNCPGMGTGKACLACRREMQPRENQVRARVPRPYRTWNMHQSVVAALYGGIFLAD